MLNTAQLLNTAQQLVESFGKGSRDYRAPHAPRGTPARHRAMPAGKRSAMKIDARNMTRPLFDKPQPVKYMHSAARRRLSEMKEAA